ncbi:MmgE/PrpD family protein [Paraburkholderia sp. USG1]|uniref:MmgE/PrpD family protein n=1 Tax=Paraburkholderia sp. USG1 TaxID=2952268 RepID=UPI00286266E5|nr:MmgE/PrpD family protein [Paraburkholderia sp. USG1]MDR8402206.1 MmgE/PrpD family protein [Paraburkholderia sp. USG1]
MTNLAREFTELILGWSADDPALIERCQLLLMDGVAVAAAGASEPGPTHVAQLSQEQSECSGPATVIGHGFSAPPPIAARINGMSMHVLDYEPMWNPPNHAVSPLLPALLALAEQREHTSGEPQGEALLRAFAKGIEAQGRLRLSSAQIEPAQLSLHPPGVVGPLATALACADLLGLDTLSATTALCIAASRSSGVMANIGSQTKALHCGDAAAHGLEAALLARRGFTANPDALGGPRGWGHAYFGERFTTEPLLAPLGVGRALVPGPSWKLFPSQFATHFGIAAALDVRAQIDASATFHADDITRIELHAPAMPYIDRPFPETGLDGKFSWQYTATIALLDGKVDPASFTNSRRFAEDAQALLNRFTLSADPGISGALDKMHVEITVHLKDGRTVTSRCDAPPGSWSRPVDAEAVTKKTRSLLESTLGHERADHTLKSVTQPPRLLSVRALMACLR